MPATANQEALAQASFIFRATVLKLKAATMASVPVTARTVIVHVDQVMQAPRLLAGYEGKDITVQLGQGPGLKKGAQATFYTNAWLFGDSVAVQSIGQTPVTGSAGVLRASAGRGIKSTADLDLEKHLAAADVVVRGRVLRVSLPEAVSVRAGQQSAAQESSRLSEHSARWNEAVVEVQSAAKGRQASRQIVVRFPRSSDVAWAQAPKFEPGQEGLFILHRATGGKAAGLAGQPGVKKKVAPETYLVLHADDFLPANRAAHVEALLQAVRTKKSAKKKPSPKAGRG
jgi:hypothetical protein